jgi:hypothetical protein
MTKRALVVGLCALAAASVASAAPQASAPKIAHLAVLDSSPLVVRGWGFESRERVSILANASGGWQGKSKVATDAGTFRVTFSESLDACGRSSVRAFGSRGSQARLLGSRFGVLCRANARGTHARTGTHADTSR